MKYVPPMAQLTVNVLTCDELKELLKCMDVPNKKELDKDLPALAAMFNHVPRWCIDNAYNSFISYFMDYRLYSSYYKRFLWYGNQRAGFDIIFRRYLSNL